MAYSLSSEADTDLTQIAAHIAEQSGNVASATRFLDTLYARFEMLADFPQAGPSRQDILGKGRRHFPIYDYTIIYEIQGDNVVILRVADSRRDIPALMGF